MDCTITDINTSAKCYLVNKPRSCRTSFAKAAKNPENPRNGGIGGPLFLGGKALVEY